MSGIAVGLGKGHTVTKLDDPTKSRPAYRKGQVAGSGPSKRVKFIRDIVLETVGYGPYEKRIMEILKIGKEKRALRFAKKRLGTHQRGMMKRSTMIDALRAKR